MLDGHTECLELCIQDPQVRAAHIVDGDQADETKLLYTGTRQKSRTTVHRRKFFFKVKLFKVYGPDCTSVR